MLLLLFSIAACKKDSSTNNPAKTIQDYLVKNNEITGWTVTSNKWVANNISELTTYINGAAEIYRRHGFIEAAYQEYQGSINSNQFLIKLIIYNQGNKPNALATYSDTDLGFNGAIDWTSGAGEAAHYLRNGGLSQQMAFYRNGYYISLEVNTGTEESLNILKQFALNVDGKLK
jgi:hypothetical protein